MTVRCPACNATILPERETERLGVSVDTVRRRIKDRTFHARKEQGRFGPTWSVWLVVPATPPAPPSGDPVAVALTGLAEHMTERMAALSRQLGDLEARIEALRQRGVSGP